MDEKIQIEYCDVESDLVKSCFHEVVERYPILHHHHILLKQKKIRQRTMQAQPIFDWSIFSIKKRKYKVEYARKVKLDDPVRIENLPKEVLIGWFAHELGHLVDYQRMGIGRMIIFAWQYIFSEREKKEAEKRADLNAVDFGFSKEILATKRYILGHSDIPAAYKANISKFYMSPEEVEEYIKQRDKPLLDLDDVPIEM